VDDSLAAWSDLREQLQLVDDTADSLHRRDASNDWLSLEFVFDHSRDGRIATSNSRTDSCRSGAFLHQFTFDIFLQRFVGDLVSKRHDALQCDVAFIRVSLSFLGMEAWTKL